MSAMKAEDIYKRHIKTLSIEERMHIVEMIGRDVAKEAQEALHGSKRSVMELHGLGKDIWTGVDVQNYINELRNDWDEAH
jgi:hypothetical protein